MCLGATVHSTQQRKMAENMEIWRKREMGIEPQGLLMNV